MKRLAPLLLALVLAATPVAADPLSDGLAAYKAEDYQKAYELLLPLAEAGDKEAQYKVGQMEAFGFGRPSNIENAIFWLKRAAARDHVKAVYALGYVLSHPRFKISDDEAAYFLFLYGAMRCDASSAVGLGTELLMRFETQPERSVEGLAWLFIANELEPEIATGSIALHYTLHPDTSVGAAEALAAKIRESLPCLW